MRRPWASERSPARGPLGIGLLAVLLLALVTGFALSFASTSWPPLLVSLPVAAGILLLDKRKRSRAAASSGV